MLTNVHRIITAKNWLPIFQGDDLIHYCKYNSMDRDRLIRVIFSNGSYYRSRKKKQCKLMLVSGFKEGSERFLVIVFSVGQFLLAQLAGQLM